MSALVADIRKMDSIEEVIEEFESHKHKQSYGMYKKKGVFDYTIDDFQSL